MYAGNRCSGSGGQVVPWCLLLIAITVALMLALVQFGLAVDDAARARTAADAAALAGAQVDQAAARRVARANGAELVSFNAVGNGVEVVVRVGQMRARAQAARSVEWSAGMSPP